MHCINIEPAYVTPESFDLLQEPFQTFAFTDRPLLAPEADVSLAQAFVP